jgi:hypothetical protein
MIIANESSFLFGKFLNPHYGFGKFVNKATFAKNLRVATTIKRKFKPLEKCSGHSN